MACTYTLQTPAGDHEFSSEAELRDYLSKTPQIGEQFDIPETFEGQRDQFLDRWGLKSVTKEGQFGYVTRNGKTPTLTLAKRMAEQMRKRSGGIYDKLAIKYDGTYGLIHINPRVEQLNDWSGPQYDIPEEPPKQKRTFNTLSRNFKMGPTDQSRYFLSPESVKTDTYTQQGEHFNVVKERNGNALSLAKHLGVSTEQLAEVTKGSNLQPGYYKDFLAGKNTVKLNLYKVDRVDNPELFLNPDEDQSVGKFKQSKIIQRTALQRRIAQVKDPKQRSELYKELNRVKSQIKDLNKPDNQNVAYLKKVFLDDKAAFDAKTFQNIRDVDYTYSLFDGYDALFRGLDLTAFGDEIQKEFEDHIKDIQDIKAKLLKTKDSIALEHMELATQVQLADSYGNLLPVKDINAFASWTLALSTTQNNPLLRYIGQSTNFAVNKAKDKSTAKKEEIKKAVQGLREWGKSQGLKGHHLYDYMLEEEKQLDRSMKVNGHFVIKYGRFYTDLSRTLKGKNEKDTATNFLRYLKNNTQSIEVLSEEYKKEWDRIHASVIEKIRLRSPDLDEKSLQDAAVIEANKIAYGIDPANFIKILDKYKTGGVLDDKDFAYVKNFVDRSAYYKFIKLQPKDEFRDPKFAAIDALPDDHPQKVFYKLFSELHYEVNERVRVDEGGTLRRNFIAEYKKDYKEDDEGFFDYLKDSVQDWALGQLTESPRDNIQGVDPLTKEITRSIPFYAFDGRIPAENKNYNLGKVAGTLAEQFYKYEALSDSEDDLLMAHHLLKNLPVYETNALGSPVVINGQPVIKQDTASMYKQADYHIMAILYNERMKKDGIGGNRYYDADTRQKIEELDKRAAAQGGDLTAEQAEQYKKLKANYTALTVKKATNALMYWTSIKNIGFNVFGGMAEIFQGISSLYLRYGASPFVHTVMPSVLQMMNPMDSAAKSKLSGLKRMFHIESDPNPDAADSKFKKVAYGPYAIARTMANTAYLVQVLKEQQVKDREGKDHSLFDIMNFDETGKIVLPAEFDNPFYKEDGTFAEYKYKLQQIVGKEIKQNRDRETDVDPIQLDRHFWGRLLGQFKASWLFEGFATRFGAEREGLNDLDTASKGIYKSFWDLSKVYNQHVNALGETETSFSLPRSLLKAMVNLAKFSSPGRWAGWGKQGDINTLDYKGAVRTAREIQSALFLYGMVMLISGMAGGDDKDKWRKMGLTYLTNFFMRTQRDMSTYFDPDSLTSIINKNVVPALGTVNEAVKLIEDPFRGIFGNNWYYNQGKSNEHFRITQDAGDLIPLVNQLRMTMNKASKKQTIFY